jgi:hypothetical protein
MSRATHRHIGDEQIASLRHIIGNEVVVSMRKGRARENGIFFDDAMIEYWPAGKHRRSPSNFAVPVSGRFVLDSEICFVISKPTEVRGRRIKAPSGKPCWRVPPLFDYWPATNGIVSSIRIFDEKMTSDDGTVARFDVRIEIHFGRAEPLSLETGTLGWGLVTVSRGLRRPWRTRRSLRLRHRLN